jgi:hypothetical protein
MRSLGTILALLTAFISLAIPSIAHAEEGAVHGTWMPADANVTDSQTWTLAGSPYVVQGTLVVNGGSISIEPGVVVKLATDATINVLDGSLLAQGTDAAPIIFTSLADDSVAGDTNADGAATDPDLNRWNMIKTAQEHAQVTMAHVRFSFSGSGWSRQACDLPITPCVNAQFSGVLVMTGGSMDISYASFDWVAGADLLSSGGTFTGDHIMFGPSYDAIHARQDFQGPQPTITVHRSNLDQSLAKDGIIWVNRGAPILNLAQNWWGSSERAA